MINYEELFDRLQENEKIAKKFHEIENRILSILNFEDLFEVLFTEIQNQFRIPYVWIALIDKSEISAQIQSSAASKVLEKRLCLIDHEIFMGLVGNRLQPLLINRNLKPFFQLFPPGRNYLIRSMAVAPIALYGKIIGSLNQADFSSERFKPGIDTSLLEQLAIKISLTLANVTMHEKLRCMAYYDSLTGLLNRRVMQSILKREFNRAKRYPAPLSVVFIDVDDFKQVNDAFGHDAGDELLKYLASRLFEMIRDSDVAARFAGDEFVLILPETAANSAEIMLKRLQGYLDSHPLTIGKEVIPVSISFGIASTEYTTILDSSMLLKSADEALYQMKKSKRLRFYKAS